MKQFIQFGDGFGAGCFGIVVIGLGVSLITLGLIGAWLA